MSGIKRQARFDGGRSPPSLRAQDLLMTSQLHRTWTLKVDAGASYIFYGALDLGELSIWGITRLNMTRPRREGTIIGLLFHADCKV
jgi:hypothetical protein